MNGEFVNLEETFKYGSSIFYIVRNKKGQIYSQKAIAYQVNGETKYLIKFIETGYYGSPFHSLSLEGRS